MKVYLIGLFYIFGAAASACPADQLCVGDRVLVLDAWSLNDIKNAFSKSGQYPRSGSVIAVFSDGSLAVDRDNLRGPHAMLTLLHAKDVSKAVSQQREFKANERVKDSAGNIGTILEIYAMGAVRVQIDGETLPSYYPALIYLHPLNAAE